MNAFKAKLKPTFKFIPQFIRMSEEQIRIQIKDSRFRSYLRNEVHQHDPFGTESCCEHNAGHEMFEAPAQDGFRRTTFQFHTNLLDGVRSPFDRLNVG